MSVNASAFDSLLPMPQDGASLYTWMKYADDAQGNGMSDSPEGKAYVGFAYNKPTPEESDNPGDYKWQKVKGDKGDDGEKGDKGDKGDDGEKGDPGDTPITMFIDKTVLFVPVDPDSGATLSTRNFSLIIRLQHGNYFDALGSSSISTLSWTTDNNTSTTMISHILASDSISSLFSVVVTVPSGQVISKRIKEISFTLKHVYAGTVYGKVQVEYVQRGIVGRTCSGCALCRSGTLDSGGLLPHLQKSHLRRGHHLIRRDRNAVDHSRHHPGRPAGKCRPDRRSDAVSVSGRRPDLKPGFQHHRPGGLHHSELGEAGLPLPAPEQAL